MQTNENNGEVHILPNHKITDFRKGETLWLCTNNADNSGVNEIRECTLESVLYTPRNENLLIAIVSYISTDKKRVAHAVGEDGGTLFASVEEVYLLNPIAIEGVPIPKHIRGINLYFRNKEGSCQTFVNPFDTTYDTTRRVQVPFHPTIDLLTKTVSSHHSAPVFTSVEDYNAYYREYSAESDTTMYSNEYSQVTEWVTDFLRECKVKPTQIFGFAYDPERDDDGMPFIAVNKDHVETIDEDNEKCGVDEDGRPIWVLCKSYQDAVGYAISKEKEKK